MEKTSRPKLLLHICCAPCSGFLSQELAEKFAVTVYFDNPNIWPEEEFIKRAEEAKKYFNRQGIDFQLTAWDHGAWQVIARDLEQEPEKGKRCKLCYYYRLKNTAEFASRNNFDYFATSLAVSPWKDDVSIRNLGLALAKKYDLEFLAEDFQADDGYGKSRAYASEQGFYRQKYCGCEFSLPVKS